MLDISFLINIASDAEGRREASFFGHFVAGRRGIVTDNWVVEAACEETIASAIK